MLDIDILTSFSKVSNKTLTRMYFIWLIVLSSVFSICVGVNLSIYLLLPADSTPIISPDNISFLY